MVLSFLSLITFSLLCSICVSQTETIIQYSGYIVDNYCHGLVRTGNLGLDGADVFYHPEDHTLHCLRDVPQCQYGYYLARKPPPNTTGGDYRVKFNLDETSYMNLLTLINSYPKGHPLDYAGYFHVTANGKHMNNDGILRDATFSYCNNTLTECDGVCIGDSLSCTTPHDLEIDPIRVGALLWLHVICMLLSWGLFLPLGFLLARHGKKIDKKICDVPYWFGMHRIFQITGVVLSTIGFLCVLLWKRARHFKVGHEILGLFIVCLGIWQPINSQLRHFKKVGHPHKNPDGTVYRTPLRKAWEVLHKGTGRLAVLLGLINVIYGPIHASLFGFGDGLVPFAAVFVTLMTGTVVIVFSYLEMKPLWCPKKMEQKNIQ